MAKKPDLPAENPRNREATTRRIVEAAARVLARDGPAGMGVNAIAAEAGADKKLIYRYFGGLEGLLAALGADTGLWIGETAPATEGDYADRMAASLSAYGKQLRGDALLQKLLAWELTTRSDTLRQIDLARSSAMRQLLPALRGDERPPEGVDAPAVNAILLAALNYLVLRGGTLEGFAGMPLRTPEDWDRVMAALEHMLRRSYAPGERGTSLPDT